MIKEIFKKHWAILFLALFLSALMVFPFFYFKIKLGDNFRGIFPEIVNDENFYYARIKDVVDGHSFLNNAYLAEHKEDLPRQLFLAEYVLAQPLKLFNINIQTGHLIYNFLLPAISFLLTYAAFYLILRRRFWSLIFSIFLFFGLYPLVFIRPVSPQFNFIFWLTQFIFLWLLVNSQNHSNQQIYSNSTNNIRSIRMFIRRFGLLGANALNFGLLFYIYPYYWTFYLILLILLAAICFISEKELSYKLLKIIAGGLILAIPYFYLNYLVSKLPEYTETLTRLGMIYTHFPSGIRIVFWSGLGLVAFSAALWRKIIVWDAKTKFFIAGILTSIIAVNQHLITGLNLEFSSHYEMSAMFFMVFAAAYLWSFVNKTKILSALVIIAVIIMIFSSLNGYFKRALAVNEEEIYIQNYAPILNWSNKNTAKDSVVYANSVLSRLIPVYTANNVFYVRDANLFYIADNEVLDRFIISNFFEDFDKNFIIENVRSIYGVRYIDDYGHIVQANKLRRLLGLKTEPEIYLSDEAIEKVIKRAIELQKKDFYQELKKYGADYLIWDKNKNPNWRIDRKFFNQVFENNGIVVYKANFD